LGRAGRIDEFGIKRLDALGGVGFEHALGLEQHQRGGSQAPDHIGLRIVLFGQQLGGDDAGGITDPVDLDIGMVLVEGFGITLEVFGLDRRIDGQFGFRIGGGACEHGRKRSCLKNSSCQFHVSLPARHRDIHSIIVTV